jgi:hypothetical protein
MPARRKTGSHRKAAADREFETLLRRAAGFQARKPRRVAEPIRKKDRTA